MTKVTPKKRAAAKTRRKPKALAGWEERFLGHLAEWPDVSRAANQAGVSRTEVYRTREQNADFAKRLEAARRVGIEAVEDAGFEMARTNPTMIIFMLKNLKPEIYAEKNQQEHSGEVRVIVEYSDRDAAAPASGASGDQA